MDIVEFIEKKPPLMQGRFFLVHKVKTKMFRILLKVSACALAVALIPLSAKASVIITEIMYDVEGTDTGREWIEVANDGSDQVDLSQWKLFEANSNHKIAAFQGGSVIPAGGFAIIADVPDKFLADHPGFSGQIFDSAFSLSGEGEGLSMKDASGVISDSVSYNPSIGAGGDGFSLQKAVSGIWIAASPTPGAQTTASQSEAPPHDPADSGSVATSTVDSSDTLSFVSYGSQEVANQEAGGSDLEVVSGRSRLGFVGVPLEFRAKVRSSSVGTSTIEHLWAMGDGSTRYGERVAYAYSFPGTYIVVLTSRYRSAEGASITEVRIVDPELSIDLADDDLVEIANHGREEINLLGMRIETARSRFVVTADTIIPPGSSLKLASHITKIGHIEEFVRVVSPAGTIIAERKAFSRDPLILLPDGLSPEDFKQRLISTLK